MPKRHALVAVALGALLFVAGVAMFSAAVALMVAGAVLAAGGLLLPLRDKPAATKSES